jgi:hypothetical protein
MALAKQVVPIPLGAGLAAGSDPKLQPSGPIVLENSVQLYAGEFRKRHGLTSIASTYTDQKMAAYKEVAYLLGESISAYSDRTSEFETIDTLGFCDVDVEHLESGGETFIYWAEVAQNDDFRAVVLKRTDNIAAASTWELRVYDRYTNEIVSSGAVANAVALRIIEVDGTLWVFRSNSSTNNLEYGAVTAAGAHPASYTAISGATNTYVSLVRYAAFDVCELGAGALLVAHKTSAEDAEACTVDDINDASPTWTVNNIAATQVEAVGCFKMDDNKGVILWADTGTTPREYHAEGYDKDGSSVVSAVQLGTWTTDPVVSICGVATSATTSAIYLTTAPSPATENNDSIEHNTFTDNSGTGVAGTGALWLYGFRPTAKPFADSTTAAQHYIALKFSAIDTDDPRPFYLILDASKNHIARFLQGYGTVLGYATFSNVHVLDTDQWLLTVIRRTGEETSSISLVTIDRTAQAGRAIETRESLLIPNASMFDFDGQEAFEQGFVTYPYSVTATAQGSGGTIADGFYGYIVVYEWYDKRGQRHLSAPSPAVSEEATAGGTDSIEVVIPNCPTSMKGGSGISVVLYRTAVNGSVYYRIKSFRNDPTARTFTYTDDGSDALGDEYVYTTGAVLEHVPAHPHRISCIHQQRYFLASAENGKIYYSKVFVENEAVAFCGDNLSVVVPPVGGDPTALASFIDRLIIFKSNRIYAIHGSGLSRTGSGAGYSEPMLISEAVGCVNHETIVETPAGLMFEGSDNIYLLDKSLNVTAIGQAALHWFRQVTLVSGHIVPDDHYAIWVSDGDALVYDYKYQGWGVFTAHAATGACVANGLLWFKSTTGSKVYQQNRASYTDGSTAISQKERIGWLSLANLGGYKRVYKALLEMQNITPHRVRIKAAYDNDPVWVDNITHDTQGNETKADGTSESDNFGWSVVLDGSWAVIGAPSGGATPGPGFAEIWHQDADGWYKQATIQPPTLDGYQAGWSVAISGDTVAIGAIGLQSITDTDYGAAYIYRRTGRTWALEQTLTPPDFTGADRFFGIDVALDGDTLAIGSQKDSYKGKCYVYTRSGTTWTLEQTFVGSDSQAGDYFSESLDISGDTIVCGAVYGASNGGAAYVFTRSGTTWTQQQKLTGLDVTYDWFGHSVAIDDDTIVVGAPYRSAAVKLGKAFVFDRASGVWTLAATLTASDEASQDRFGDDVAINGEWICVGANGDDDLGSNAGAAYAYRLLDAGWTEIQKIHGTDTDTSDYFGGYQGMAIDINSDGVFAIGASGVDDDTGAVYFYDGQLLAFDTSEHFGDGLSDDYRHHAHIVRFSPSRQKCTSIMLEISDESLPGSTVGQGFALSAISLEIGTKQGQHRVDRRRRFK